MNLKEEIFRYLKANISIIPVGPDKKPLVPWLEYQKRRATPEEVETWFKRFPDLAFIGIVTGRISGLVVIDIDEICGFDHLVGLMYEDLPIPGVSTPGGGQHWYFLNPSKEVRNATSMLPGVDFRGEGGIVVVPPSKGYEWIPNCSIWDVTIPVLPDSIVKLLNINSHFPREEINQTSGILTEGRRDEDLFHLANSLIKGGMPLQEVRDYLIKFAIACDPPFPRKEVDIKVDSALKRNITRTAPLAGEIEAWVNSTNGYFSIQDCERALLIVTKRDKENVRQTLFRLVPNILARHPTKNGYFRRIELNFPVMDLIKPRPEPLGVLWPLDLNRFYHCYSKNIVVIAGAADVGKSAFCFNFAFLNRNHFKVNYFSSEMGEDELQIRLSKFDVNFNEWPKIKWITLASDYADAIKPDEINIIDFMEIHEEFWRLGGWINDVFRKLTTGMCLIALQKPRFRDVAKGGEPTLEKPRLYLSMDYGKIKILKCKNWATDQNPNGLSLEFKIVGGHKFITDNQWGVPWDEVGK